MPALSTRILNGLPATSSASNKSSDNNSTVEETKKFTCKKCGASFSLQETFTRHMNFYCNIKEEDQGCAQNESTSHLTMTPNQSTQSSSTTPNLAEILMAFQQQQNRRQNTMQHSLLDPNAFASNTIILPVAYHQALDQSLIQIVGPSQTVIPVAIGRNIPTVCKPLLLDGSLLHSLQLPANGRLPVGSSEFGLSLAFIQPFTLPFLNGQLNRQFAQHPSQQSNPSSSATATATITSLNALSPSLICAVNNKRTRSAISTKNTTTQKRRCVSADQPLDLSKNSKTDESVISSPASDTIETEVEKLIPKRYLCQCGVSFLALDTLTSHRKYYCRNRVIDEEEERELIRKVPSRCSQCDYVPATHAQLAQHVRHKHCAVQAYVCLLCGYKGYSARGIKNHLRNSHSDEMSKRKATLHGDEKSVSNVLSDKSLLQDYVFCVTDENKTQQMACTQCKSTFPSESLLKCHKCPAKSEDD